MYDNVGQDNGQPIDEKLYLGGTQMDSLLLQTTSGRITLEIVGLSDYTKFSQASIDKYEDGLVSGKWIFLQSIQRRNVLWYNNI